MVVEECGKRREREFLGGGGRSKGTQHVGGRTSITYALQAGYMKKIKAENRNRMDEDERDSGVGECGKTVWEET